MSTVSEEVESPVSKSSRVSKKIWFKFGWLVGWLVGWLPMVGWLVGWLVGGKFVLLRGGGIHIRIP